VVVNIFLALGECTKLIKWNHYSSVLPSCLNANWNGEYPPLIHFSFSCIIVDERWWRSSLSWVELMMGKGCCFSRTQEQTYGLILSSPDFPNYLKLNGMNSLQQDSHLPCVSTFQICVYISIGNNWETEWTSPLWNENDTSGNEVRERPDEVEFIDPWCWYCWNELCVSLFSGGSEADVTGRAFHTKSLFLIHN